jgi:hypothetical protein
MSPGAFAFSASLWKYSGRAAWYFLTLPPEVAQQIKPLAPKLGFGAVRVHVTIGGTTWKTSVFPDKASGSYVLPIKAMVRQRESLTEGSDLVVFIEL